MMELVSPSVSSQRTVSHAVDCEQAGSVSVAESFAVSSNTSLDMQHRSRFAANNLNNNISYNVLSLTNQFHFGCQLIVLCRLISCLFANHSFKQQVGLLGDMLLCAFQWSIWNKQLHSLNGLMIRHLPELKHKWNSTEIRPFSHILWCIDLDVAPYVVMATTGYGVQIFCWPLHDTHD